MPGPAPDAAAASVPTIHAAGGGGGGGGGSGKKGKKGKGKKKAKKGKGKEKAPGGKKGAKGSKCGSGAPCSRCNTSISRGDPVDVASGRAFTIPETDLELFGPLRLQFERSYASTNHDRDVGLGWGWAHSLGWEIEVMHRFLRVHKDDGTAFDFPKVRVGEETIGDEGWLLRGEPDGYVVDAKDGVLRRFTLETPDAKRCRLTSIQDLNDNRITLTYDRGRLVEIVDCVGRVVKVTNTNEGRIASLDVTPAPGQPSTRFAAYRYDADGNLREVTDAAGYVRRFFYDEDHLLTSHSFDTGLTFHFKYDDEHRCVETWGHYGGKPDISLSENVPQLLADGRTRAKGFFHCKLTYDEEQGFTEVVDSRQVQRFFANEHGKLDKVSSGSGVYTRTYDEQGNEVSLTDPSGATWQWERDARGREIKRIDPLGRTIVVNRDAAGNVIEQIDEIGAIVKYEYDSRGNLVRIIDPIGSVVSITYDARGLTMGVVERNGGSAKYTYDAHGNETEAVLPNGSVWRERHDAFGRVIEKTDPLGATTRFEWGPRHELMAVQHPDGNVTRYEYDAEGHLICQTGPDGRTYRLEYGGYHSLANIHRPDGSVVRIRCDREMQVVEIKNEAGELHLFEYDTAGRLVGEKTFDGRRLAYRYDVVGRLVGHTNASGKTIEVVYDAAGQIIEKKYPDDTSEQFEYDARGDLVCATNDFATIRLERDLRGCIVRETQDVAGETHVVENAYDVMEEVVRRQTSLGLVEEIRRDVMGWRERTVLNGRFSVGEKNDLVGQLVQRILPGGGVIESAFNAFGQPVQRTIVSPAQQVAVRKGEPDWVGARPTGTTKSFKYDTSLELTDAWDSSKGLTRYEYDRAMRLSGWTPDHRPGQLFRYDAAGNMTEVGGQRTYGKGGRLLTKGDTDYAYDADGKLVEKKKRLPDGTERIWTYAWNGKGLLESVETPEGSVVQFAYDAFARRVKKTVARPPRPEAPPVITDVTRFVWDEDVIVQEVKRRASESGDEIVEEKTFCFEDESFVPWAQGGARTEAGNKVDEPWLVFFNDPNGSPDRLVAEDGSVAGEIDQSAWGEFEQKGSATTPIRYQGQYADDETGLVYNRFRYYDPDAGRYINADPIGIDGGLNAYIYAPNPTGWMDPFGLTHFAQGQIFGSEADMAAGNPRATSPQVDSTMTPAMKANIDAAGEQAKAQKKSQKDARNSEAARQRQKCHTERKLTDPGKWAKKQGLKKGEILVIEAQSVDGSKRRPPCSGCRGAMKRLSKETGATVIYKPGMGGRMDRPWVCKGGKVTSQGK